jgi:hypothetical protein
MEVHRLSGLGLADDREGDVALGAQFGHGLEQVRQTLQRHVGGGGGDEATRAALDVGLRLEQVDVDTDGHQAHAVVADTHVGVDVLDRVLADHHDARHLAGDLALHLHERIPAADRTALAPVRGVAHLEFAVLGDRVVQRDDRGDHLLDLEDPGAETLVVVDQVEVAGAALECLVRPGRERHGFAEGAGEVLGDLEDVLTGLDLPVRREATRVLVVEDVEAGQGSEGDPVVEHRVGLTAEHLHGVARSASALVRCRVYTPCPPTWGLPR